MEGDGIEVVQGRAGMQVQVDGYGWRWKQSLRGQVGMGVISVPVQVSSPLMDTQHQSLTAVQHSRHWGCVNEGATSSCQNVRPRTPEADFLWWALCGDPTPTEVIQSDTTKTVSRLTYVAVISRRKIGSLLPWTAANGVTTVPAVSRTLKSTGQRLDMTSRHGGRRLYIIVIFDSKLSTLWSSVSRDRSHWWWLLRSSSSAISINMISYPCCQSLPLSDF